MKESSFEVVYQDPAERWTAYEQSVRNAFSGKPYVLPTKYLFDEKGSTLFEQFAASNPGYHSSTELDLLSNHSSALRRILNRPRIVEFGSGACRAFTQLMALGIVRANAFYQALDISPQPLLKGAAMLQQRFPALAIRACVCDFDVWDPGNYLGGMETVLLWLGNSATNMQSEELKTQLQRLPYDPKISLRLLLGIHLDSYPPNFETRFQDADGLFDRFRWNVMERLNNDWSGNFNPGTFTLGLEFNPIREQVESFFQTRFPQSVLLSRLDLRIEFGSGDRLIIGITRRYSLVELTALLARAGWRIQNVFGSHDNGFALVDAERVDTGDAG